MCSTSLTEILQTIQPLLEGINYVKYEPYRHTPKQFNHFLQALIMCSTSLMGILQTIQPLLAGINYVKYEPYRHTPKQFNNFLQA